MTASAINLKLKFPEFADVDNAVVQFALDEGYLFVTDKWQDKFKDLGAMYMAAHLLSVSNANALAFENAGQEVASESIGRMSTSYRQKASPSTGAPPGSEMTTTYGVRYLDFCKMQFPAVCVI